MKNDVSLTFHEKVDSFFYRFGSILFPVLFLVVAYLSFRGLFDGVCMRKYYLHWNLSGLMQMYEWFNEDFLSFIIKSLTWHQGDSESTFSSFFFLFPFFSIIKVIGSLSIYSLYVYSCVIQLLFFAAFYFFVSSAFGRRIAFLAAFFLGTSAVFQEMVRSGNYYPLTLLAAVGIIYLLYRVVFFYSSKSLFALAALIGVSWYLYGVIRPLSVFAFLTPFFVCRKRISSKELGLYILIVLAILGLGLTLLMLKTGTSSSFFVSLFDEEYISFNDERLLSVVRDFFINIKLLFLRACGAGQRLFVFDHSILEYDFHAHFINKWLSLFLGIGFILSVLKAFKNAHFRLFLLVSCIVIIPMLFTSSFGYAQARRSALYLIPFYVFAGIGVDSFLRFVINHLRNPRSQWFVLMLFVFFAGSVFISENAYVRNQICSPKRDFGFVDFAQKASPYLKGKSVFYMERADQENLYMYGSDSEILRFLLYRFDCKVESLILKQQNLSMREVYVVKSPYISPAVFSDSFMNDGFQIEELCSVKLEYMSKLAEERISDRYLSLYQLKS